MLPHHPTSTLPQQIPSRATPHYTTTTTTHSQMFPSTSTHPPTCPPILSLQVAHCLAMGVVYLPGSMTPTKAERMSNLRLWWSLLHLTCMKLLGVLQNKEMPKDDWVLGISIFEAKLNPSNSMHGRKRISEGLIPLVIQNILDFAGGIYGK